MSAVILYGAVQVLSIVGLTRHQQHQITTTLRTFQELSQPYMEQRAELYQRVLQHLQQQPPAAGGAAATGAPQREAGEQQGAPATAGIATSAEQELKSQQQQEQGCPPPAAAWATTGEQQQQEVQGGACMGGAAAAGVIDSHCLLGCAAVASGAAEARGLAKVVADLEMHEAHVPHNSHTEQRDHHHQDHRYQQQQHCPPQLPKQQQQEQGCEEQQQLPQELQEGPDDAISSASPLPSPCLRTVSREGPVDLASVLPPIEHGEVFQLSSQLEKIMCKLAWIDCCFWFYMLGVLSWRQLSKMVVHMHPYTLSVKEMAELIAAREHGQETAPKGAARSGSTAAAAMKGDLEAAAAVPGAAAVMEGVSGEAAAAAAAAPGCTGDKVHAFTTEHQASEAANIAGIATAGAGAAVAGLRRDEEVDVSAAGARPAATAAGLDAGASSGVWEGHGPSIAVPLQPPISQLSVAGRNGWDEVQSPRGA